jgi:hypothetical protein
MDQMDFGLFSPNLPHSQSISNQLCIREGQIVNIPLNLIVRGDLVLLRPGQLVNFSCRSLDKQPKLNEYAYFESGKAYEPFDSKNPAPNSLNFATSLNANLGSCMNREAFLDLCEFKQMNEPLKCIALETPYLIYLK